MDKTKDILITLTTTTKINMKLNRILKALAYFVPNVNSFSDYTAKSRKLQWNSWIKFCGFQFELIPLQIISIAIVLIRKHVDN